jgi:WD40 repeat protein
VLQNSVRLYALKKPLQLIASYETADNVHGLAALSKKAIAFPGRTTGQVQLVDIKTGNVSIIPAHSSALRAMKLSPDGELLATAGDKVS